MELGTCTISIKVSLWKGKGLNLEAKPPHTWMKWVPLPSDPHPSSAGLEISRKMNNFVDLPVHHSHLNPCCNIEQLLGWKQNSLLSHQRTATEEQHGYDGNLSSVLDVMLWHWCLLILSCHCCPNLKLHKNNMVTVLVIKISRLNPVMSMLIWCLFEKISLTEALIDKNKCAKKKTKTKKYVWSFAFHSQTWLVLELHSVPSYSVSRNRAKRSRAVRGRETGVIDRASSTSYFNLGIRLFGGLRTQVRATFRINK